MASALNDNQYLIAGGSNDRKLQDAVIVDQNNPNRVEVADIG